MNSSRKDDEKILSPDFLDEIKRVREERNISIEEVAEKTNIKAAYIKAIEEGDLARLPGGIYNRAYIRSVSEFLGINLKPFERAVEPDDNFKEKQVKVELGRPYNTSMPTKSTLIGSLFVIFLLYSIFYGPSVTKKEKIDKAVENYQEQEVEKAETVAKAQGKEFDEDKFKPTDRAEIVKTMPDVSPIQKETEKFVKKELVLSILAKNRARVQVKDGFSKVVFDKDMDPAEAAMFNGSQEYYVGSDNLKNIEIFLDGVQIRDLNKLQVVGHSVKLSAADMIGIIEKQPILVQKQAAAVAPSSGENVNTETPAEVKKGIKGGDDKASDTESDNKKVETETKPAEQKPAVTSEKSVPEKTTDANKPKNN